MVPSGWANFLQALYKIIERKYFAVFTQLYLCILDTAEPGPGILQYSSFSNAVYTYESDLAGMHKNTLGQGIRRYSIYNSIFCMTNLGGF